MIRISFHGPTMHRLLSLAVGAFYLVGSYAAEGGYTASRVALFLVFPLAMIWAPEGMGDFQGMTGRGYINRKSPGSLVRFVGWMVLFSPVVAALIVGAV